MAVVVWIYTKGSRDRSGVGRTFIPVETVYTPAVVADLDTLGLLPVGSSAIDWDAAMVPHAYKFVGVMLVRFKCRLGLNGASWSRAEAASHSYWLSSRFDSDTLISLEIVDSHKFDHSMRGVVVQTYAIPRSVFSR